MNTTKVAFSPLQAGTVKYAAHLLREGFFEGWLVHSTIENLLLAVYTDDFYTDDPDEVGYGSQYCGGIAKFEADRNAFVA